MAGRVRVNLSLAGERRERAIVQARRLRMSLYEFCIGAVDVMVRMCEEAPPPDTPPLSDEVRQMFGELSAFEEAPFGIPPVRRRRVREE